jgi:hypothetical protein
VPCSIAHQQIFHLALGFEPATFRLLAQPFLQLNSGVIAVKGQQVAEFNGSNTFLHFAKVAQNQVNNCQIV